MYKKVFFCFISVFFTSNAFALNSDLYEFIYAYKVDNKEQYIVEIGRKQLLDGIASKKYHPSTVVHWLLIDEAHQVYPLKLKWLDEVREMSPDVTIGEIQQRTFAGYHLYSEITSGKALFSYADNRPALKLKHISKGQELNVIDDTILHNIGLYLDDFYRATYLIEQTYRCESNDKNTKSAVELSINYYGKAYDKGFIANTNAPINISIRHKLLSQKLLNVHGDMRIEHSAKQGITNQYYDIFAEDTVNPFYQTEQTKLDMQNNLIGLRTVFGEQFTSLTLATKVNSTKVNSTKAQLVVTNKSNITQECQLISSNSTRSLQEVLM